MHIFPRIYIFGPFSRFSSSTFCTLTFNNRTTFDEMTMVWTNSCQSDEKISSLVISNTRFLYIFFCCIVNVSFFSFLLKIHEMNLHSVRESHKVHFYSTDGCLVLLYCTATHIRTKSSCPIFLKLLTAQ